MEHTWVLKLKLKDKYREEVEEYFLSLNASISSIDAENNLNTLKPKLFNSNIQIKRHICFKDMNK